MIYVVLNCVVRNILKSINGIVLPGGGADLSPNNGYYDAVTIIYRLAKEVV